MNMSSSTSLSVASPTPIAPTSKLAKRRSLQKPLSSVGLRVAAPNATAPIKFSGSTLAGTATEVLNNQTYLAKGTPHIKHTDLILKSNSTPPPTDISNIMLFSNSTPLIENPGGMPQQMVATPSLLRRVLGGKNSGSRHGSGSASNVKFASILASATPASDKVFIHVNEVCFLISKK